jgi:hypothetical protein
VGQARGQFPRRPRPLGADLSTPDAAIVTAIFDHYDTLKPALPQTGTSVEWVLVTDDLEIPDGHLGWRVVFWERPGVAPMRAAKAAKFRPWEFTQAPASVWIDASVRVTSPALAADLLGKGPLVTFRHRFWDCLYREAEISAAMPKYDGEPVAAQADHYRRAGHPAHWGLWETTVLARHHTPAVRALGDAWAAEVAAWSSQDQVSFPFVLREAGLRPERVPGGRDGSPWHIYAGSGRHDDSYRAEEVSL